MNKLGKILSATVLAAGTVSTAAAYSRGFSADEKETIELVQQFMACVETADVSGVTVEQRTKAQDKAAETITNFYAQIGREIPQQEKDILIMEISHQILTKNICAEKMNIDPDVTQVKVDAMVKKHGEEAVKKAIYAPKP